MTLRSKSTEPIYLAAREYYRVHCNEYLDILLSVLFNDTLGL
jgi:hypothetical protein